MGKTSLFHQYTRGKFNASYKPTIGVDFATKDMAVGGDTVRLQVSTGRIGQTLSWYLVVLNSCMAAFGMDIAVSSCNPFG